MGRCLLPNQKERRRSHLLRAEKSDHNTERPSIGPIPDLRRRLGLLNATSINMPVFPVRYGLRALGAALTVSWLCYGLVAAQSRRVYLGADDHTDYLWSGDEETYRQAMVGMLDYYLDLADATEQSPAEHQSRWNCDGSFWVWEYERSKPAAAVERLVRRIRDGHISVPLNALVSTYGGTPAEATLRGMYYAGRLERRFGLRFPLAIAMENQTLPLGLGSLFAGAGARYSWKGVCACVSKILDKSYNPRPKEIYWWQGLDGSRILLKWNSLVGTGPFGGPVGAYAEARDPPVAMAAVESEQFKALYKYDVVGIFGVGGDDLQTMSDKIVVAAKAGTNPQRKVVVSNTVDFFQDFEAAHGKDLPAQSLAFGNEWDLYSASLAEVTARVRRSVESLRAAEAMATLVALARPEFLEGRQAARDQAWMNLGLYWEHDWTSGDSQWITPATRARWQKKVAAQIEAYVDSLHGDAAFALGDLIEKHGSAERFYAFNPTSWPRTDFADLPYDGDKHQLAWPVHVVDLTTGKEVPAQIVKIRPLVFAGTGRQHLRILAKDVPPLGYKVFEIRSGKGSEEELPPAAVAAGGVMENGLYRIEVAERGAITSLVDKSMSGREFVRLVDGRAVNDLGPGAGKVEVENAGPVSVTLTATASGPLPHVTRVTLFRDLGRIDIQNEITSNFSDVREWGFGINVRAPDVWHEEVGAVIRAKLASDGGHYSPTHSRLDWLTLNHYAAMSGDDGAGIVLSSADLSFMKLGRSAVVNRVSHLDVRTPLISVLAGGQVDGPKLGMLGQGDDSYFLQRFALRPHVRFDAVDAMKFALEHQNPLVAGFVRGGSKRAYPETTFSLVTISDPNVVLWAFKPAEDGIDKGIVARVWNLAPAPRDFSLSIAGGLSAATAVTHIETDIGQATVSNGALVTSVAASQMKTFRLTVTTQAKGK
jgi:alpha-mannosidase